MASERSGNVVAIKEHLRKIVESGGAMSPRETREELMSTIEELRVAAQSLEEQNEQLSELLTKVDAARDHYEELFALVPDATFVTDEHGLIEEVNEAAQKLFGMAGRRLLGKPLVLLLAGGDSRSFHTALRRIPEAPKVAAWDSETNWHGKRLKLTVRASRDRHPEAEPRRLRWVVRDRTEELALLEESHRLRLEVEEARREDAERARLAELGAVVENIRHDLGNPLAGLRLLFRGLLRKLARLDSETARDAEASAREIALHVNRLQAMLDQLGDFSRARRLRLASIDLHELVDAAARLWTPVAEGTGASLSVRIEEGVGSIVGDATQLSRVLDNLIKNAIEAVAVGPGTIAIEVRGFEPGWVRLSVTDSGSGLPANFAFGLFRSTRPGGSGLGLAVARSVATAHGGRLTFDGLEAPHSTSSSPNRRRSGGRFPRDDRRSLRDPDRDPERVPWKGTRPYGRIIPFRTA